MGPVLMLLGMAVFLLGIWGLIRGGIAWARVGSRRASALVLAGGLVGFIAGGMLLPPAPATKAVATNPAPVATHTTASTTHKAAPAPKPSSSATLAAKSSASAAAAQASATATAVADASLLASDHDTLVADMRTGNFVLVATDLTQAQKDYATAKADAAKIGALPGMASQNADVFVALVPTYGAWLKDMAAVVQAGQSTAPTAFHDEQTALAALTEEDRVLTGQFKAMTL